MIRINSFIIIENMTFFINLISFYISQLLFLLIMNMKLTCFKELLYSLKVISNITKKSKNLFDRIV